MLIKNFLFFLLTITNGIYGNSFLGPNTFKSTSLVSIENKKNVCKMCKDNFHFKNNSAYRMATTV